MLADKLLVPYFEHGFDDSLASATPNIPQLPYLQAKLQREANRRESEIILAKAHSRGYASVNESETVLSLGPISSVLNAFVLESLLPFSHEINQALEQGNLQRALTLSNQWHSWLERSRGNISQEAEDNVKEKLAYLKKLDRQLSDPVLGKLTIKLAQAIKQEQWEDAKNIQSLLREMEYHEPQKTTARSQYQSDNGEKCASARRDYSQAVAAYNAAKSDRGSSRAGEALGILGSISGKPEAGLWGALLAGVNSNEAKDSQADMNHALRLLEDAKGRMSIYCGN